MKHRRSLLALLLALLLVLSMTGCAEKPQSQPEPPSTTATGEFPPNTEDISKPGTKTEFALAYLPEHGFNPFSCTSLTNRTVFSLLYEGLFTVTGDLRAEPVLCANFSVSEDQMTYRLKIAPNITFSDGSPLTASDVVYSLNSAKLSDFYAARLEHISYVSADDDRTLTIWLDEPYENLPLVLDIPVVKSSTRDDQIPIGSGPYAVRKETEGISLVRNADWWQHGAPAVDVPVITMAAQTTAIEIRDAFEFGEIDLVCIDPNSSNTAGYHCNYEVWDCTTTNMQYLGFNLASNIFAGDELRCAVTYAINRTQIVKELMGGYAVPTSIPCVPSSPYYDNSLAEEYDYDPEQFRSALQSSGVSTKNDPGIFLVCSEDPGKVKIAQYIARELEGYGLYLKVNALDYKSYVKALKANQFDVYYGEVKLTANFDLSCFYDPDSALNVGYATDLSLAEQCLDALENSGNYHTLFANVMRDGAICPILFKEYAVYMSRGTVEYLAPAVDNVLHLAGGRTLADANVPYDSQASAPDNSTDEP
ncbi:MAG: ABC transporter substrate-binding protein [Clostridia bacterium]|nr:ABC transporter substrate-binding protein [Clostridia bacterium]